MILRCWRAALVGSALLMLVGRMAGPAHADSGGSMDMWSTAVVTRLTLTDGRGWLTVQPYFRTDHFTGFYVDLPAGDGAWSGLDTIAVPELATTCRRAAGPGLHYDCGQTSLAEPSQEMAVGGYSVSIPVSYSGDDADTLWGTSDDITEGSSGDVAYLGGWNPDTFPVYDADHFRSSAELRVARLTWGDPSTALLPVTLTVVPGEHVTALSVPFLHDRYALTGTNAAAHGLQCYVRTAENDLHCKPAVGTTAFPAGRYTMTAQLRWVGSDPYVGESTYGSPVLLTVDGQGPEIVDTGLFWGDEYD